MREPPPELPAPSGLLAALDMEVVEATPERVAVTMPVTPCHLQPLGYLHAGPAWRWPLHAGRTSQIWQTEIRDERGRLVCLSRRTLAVVPVGREEAGGGSARRPGRPAARAGDARAPLRPRLRRSRTPAPRSRRAGRGR